MVKFRFHILLFFLLVALGFIAYGNSLNGEFIWDDDILIEDNILIRDISHIPDIFTKINISASTGKTFHFYRPLQILTYMFDYHIWKFNPLGYHLTNISLHILTALSLYLFVLILLKDKAVSLTASILFLIHPVHTEAVAYIAGRADPLSALFLSLCLGMYLKYFETNKLSFFVISLFSYALALISRENTIVIPFLILVYHFCFRKKINWLRFGFYAGISAAYIILRMTRLSHLLAASYGSGATTVIERIPRFLCCNHKLRQASSGACQFTYGIRR
ncbi:MAG: hypothetical protein ABH872_07045 [Candidatus Omnitrophota bacterium]